MGESIPGRERSQCKGPEAETAGVGQAIRREVGVLDLNLERRTGIRQCGGHGPQEGP